MATSGMLPPPPSDSELWSEKDFAAIVVFLATRSESHSNLIAWAFLQARLAPRSGQGLLELLPVP